MMMGRANAKDKKSQKTKFYFSLLTSHFLLNKKAQVMIEFTFCMIILFLMMYGIIMIFRWVGLDLGQRQQAHEAVLTAEIDHSYGDCVFGFLGTCLSHKPVEPGPLNQIDPYFYTPAKMKAVWAGD